MAQINLKITISLNLQSININNNKYITNPTIGDLMDYTSSDLLNKISDGDHTQAKDVFSALMNDRVLSELGAKKVEIARSLLPSSEIPHSEVVFDKAKDISQEENEDEKTS